jgi:uncharacterized protein YdeI (YjbR/CyaY-like superfamily)
MSDAYDRLTIRSRAQWRAWLGEHHADVPGVWVVTYKKGRGPHVPYAEVVEEALAFGWIDGRGRRLDDDRFMLLVTPRRPASKWSGINKERIERLTAAGLMTPAGEAVVAAAKASGTWTALDAVEALIEPDELRAALDADADARRHWDAFPPSTKRAILQWIADAKRPETLARRVEDTARLAAENVRARG